MEPINAYLWEAYIETLEMDSLMQLTSQTFIESTVKGSCP